MTSSRDGRRDRAAAVVALAALAPLALVAAGCGAEFDPPSWLVDLRVLAIEAQPLDVVGEAEVTARARLYVPPDRTVVRERWTFCPLTAGARAAWACVDEACEVELTPGPDAVVRVQPLPQLLACAANLGAAAGPDAAGGLGPDGAALPDEVEVVLRYEAEDDQGLVRESVLRLTLWLDEGPAAPNRAPALEAVTADGTALAEGAVLPPVAEGGQVALRVRVAADSLDTYEDVDGSERQEEPIVVPFATAGRFDPERAAGADAALTWTAEELEPEDAGADLYLLVLDLRGGQALAGPYHVPIARAPGEAPQ